MTLTCVEIRDLAPAFVLGALGSETMAAVREHLAACPELHAELAELGSVVPYLLDEPEPVAPRPALRGRVMQAITAEAAGGGRALDAGPPLAVGRAPAGGARLSVVPRGGRILRWALAAAAVVAIVALATANLFLRSDLQASRDYAERLSGAVALAATPGARIGIVGGNAAGPSGIAVVAAGGGAAIVLRDLAPTTGSQVYTAWAIAGQAAPRPIGSFEAGPDGRGWLEGASVPEGGELVVAFTREPRPGATSPTLPIVASTTLRPAGATGG